jgi:mannose-6-phosphate isomerase-like protein (cupin superfamily)
MLDTQTFKTVVENAPLVSIDLCLVCGGQILLGKRNNEPLKGEWFTPGGRIHKNETWQHALLRIVKAELGLCDIAVENFSLMGVWDHFYNNSGLDQNISTKDVLIVAHKDSVQDVKAVAQQLKAESRTEWEHHREVCRPWGKYDSIDSGERYQAKRITVKPGAKLSVQMHHHRSEHRVVVSGAPKVTNGDDVFLLSENESTYIPAGVIHALENPGKLDLELIAIQTGSYLGEDDIVRLEDNYGRA